MIKKLVASGLVVLSALAVSVCYAAPVGNPSGPVLLDGTYPTKITLEAEAVQSRKMNSGNSGVPKFSGQLMTLKGSFYVGHKLDIYGLVGTYEGKVRNFIGEQYIINSKFDGVFGGGVSYVLYELEFLRGILRLGVDGKYRQCKTSIDRVQYYRDKIDTSNNLYTFSEWQGAMGLGYQYKKIAPYMGVKYSNIESHIKFKQGAVEHSETDMNSQRRWGLYYGVDLLASDTVSVNIEGRCRDEKAVSAGLNIRF